MGRFMSGSCRFRYGFQTARLVCFVFESRKSIIYGIKSSCEGPFGTIESRFRFREGTFYFYLSLSLYFI